MKRLIVVLLCVLMIAVMALPAMAAEEWKFEDGYAVLEYWSETGYPDYVTGIWATDGGYMVGLVEGPVGEAAKEEILASMKKDLYLLFTYQTYPLWELEQVQEELMPYFDRDWGLCSTGIHQQENVVTVGIDPDNPMAEELAAELTSKYGDRIRVEEGGTVILYAGKPSLSPRQVVWLVSVTGVLLLFGGFCVAALRQRGVQTADGRVMTKDVPLSRRAMEDAVRKAEEYPRTTLHDIVEKLEN